MDIKFSKDSDGSQPVVANNRGSQNIKLIVLLLLVAIVAYVYFFTGLIKPETEQKVAQAPASQVAKKPLPAADGAPVKADAGEAKVDAAAPAVKPETAAAAPAAPAAAAKPAGKEVAKAKEEPKAAEEAQSAVKKPLPGIAKADAKKPAPVEKKQPVVAENKPQPAKEAEKKPVEVKKPVEAKKPVEKQAAAATTAGTAKKAAQKPVKKAVEAPAAGVTGTGNWTVLVGSYVLEEAMATDLARVRKAGQEAFIVAGAQKKSHMNRLLLAEFTDRDSAQAELARLKRVTADAFMIETAGMHAVYAGSYLLDARAASERERLAAAGFKLTVKRVDVALPAKNLTAGSFPEKSAADAVLKKLRAAGVKATLTRQ